MKLATLRATDSRNRMGDLIVVSQDNETAVLVDKQIATSLLDAVQNWKAVEPKLHALSAEVNSGKAKGSFKLDLHSCLAPLPLAPAFLDGSAFLSHVVRARKARGDVMPESAKVTPLMYQGVSDNLLGAFDPIDLIDEDFGGDFEGEFGAITVDVPRATAASHAGRYIALFTLLNDITLREIVKVELQTKFGFLQSKPNSSFAPLVVTPDELGDLWDGKRIQADMEVTLNGKAFGHPNGREMHFTFGDLIAHACRTRPLSAGTIIGTGTISNESLTAGFACLTEKRCQEMIESGKATTPWLRRGDRVTLDVEAKGISIFGPIDEVAR